ncbi:hypothetical protein CL634_06870 [bacterium]|nr:hypothetical protein [bacterium]|tara:strand:+ start:395 stop:661 length:267 start_codon:yes stop_codon:yes gene_type:complete
MTKKLKYEFVCETPSGYGLFRAKNLAGGYCYVTDELNSIIWDTAITNSCDLLCAIVEEDRRRVAERHSKKACDICAPKDSCLGKGEEQ